MELKKKIIEYVDSISDEITGISSFIHKHPELGENEYESSSYLCDFLCRHGFSVEKNYSGYPTAFRAVYDSSKPGRCFAYCAEYDALPEIGHGCGHNIIAASALGAALAVKKAADEIGGKVVVFGTPAEESLGCKVPMVQGGCFADIDATIMLHPETKNIVNVKALAMNALQFNFRGKSSHAACTPHEGLNALDAVIMTFNAINALRQQIKPDARIHGIITRGGTAVNMIPDDTEVKFYVRSESRDYLNTLVEKVVNCARGAALQTGTELAVKEFEYPMDDLKQNGTISMIAEKYLRELGLEITPVDEEPGSSDYGNVSYAVPAAYCYIATAGEGVELHTREFTESACSEYADKALIKAVKVMALTAVDIMSDEELYNSMTNEFMNEISDTK